MVEKNGGGFQNALPFREELKTVSVNTDWVEGVFQAAVELARQPEPPVGTETCEHCRYVVNASKFRAESKIEYGA